MVSMDKAYALKQASTRGADLKLFIRNVRDKQGRKRPITVRSWSTIKDIKDVIQQSMDIPARSQRLFFGPLMTSGKELPNHRSLHDVGIDTSGQTILLDIKDASTLPSSSSSIALLQKEVRSDVVISSAVIDSTPKPLKQVVQSAKRALALGLKPEFILEGSGGTYFLHDTRKVKIAVFKPADEEPYAENNPRGYLQQAGPHVYLREGIVPGEACIREVAAFMMDHSGFSGVPMTTLVEARHPSFNNNGSRLNVAEGGASIGAHSIAGTGRSSSSLAKKVGSFQEFIRCECSMDDISPSLISVDQVHKIAILDIRLMNADRNSANLLCRRRSDNSVELIPIDHGFCLRSVADVSWMDWCWLDWPQMKQVRQQLCVIMVWIFLRYLTSFYNRTQPMSQATKNYILKLDIENDSRILKERLNIGTEALDYFCASSSILKAGVNAGLSLYEIAIMCCRNDDLGEIPSKLEMLLSMAADLAESALENGRWHHAAASKALAEQLSPKGGSLLTYSSNSSRVLKAQSAVDLAHYSEDMACFDTFTSTKKDCTPGGVTSSGSDSSSDNGDGDLEEEGGGCQEWATNLIADMSLDKSNAAIAKKGRSSSVGSDASTASSEAEGFWYTNPNTSPSLSVESDDESVTWSPANSPTNMSFMELSVSGLRNAFNPITGMSRRASVILNQDELTNTSPMLFRSSSKVTFAKEPVVSPARDDRHPLETLFNNHGKSDVVVQSEPSSSFPRKETIMKRSQSYSALTSMMAEKFEEEDASRSRRAVNPEQYREYFLKFIDLVIVRETTAASLVKGPV